MTNETSSDYRLMRVETRVAVLEADHSHLSADLQEVKQDVKAGNRSTITNLWVTIGGILAVVLTVLLTGAAHH